MPELFHLFPRDSGDTEQYTYASKVGSAPFKVPPRDDRVGHSHALVAQLGTAEQEAQSLLASKAATEKPKGVVLDFESDPSFKLQLKSMEAEASGIELRNSRVSENGVMHATVFVPDGKIGIFVRKFEAYADPSKDSKPKNPERPSKPRNNDLVASIGQVRLAALESFWTDAGAFPSDRGDRFPRN